MRIKLISPVAGVAVVASGLAVMTAGSSSASPVKLYFHSASGTYRGDVAADPVAVADDAAPAGSTLSATPPTKTTDATATGARTYEADFAGAPILPTFVLPFKGDVTSVCIDIWAKSTTVTPTLPFYTQSLFNTPAAFLENEDIQTAGYTGGDYIRITKLVKAENGKATVVDGTEFIIGGYVDVNPDWTMAYDSVTRPSSITLNPTSCTPTPIVVPSGSASATPSPSGSATASPTGSATATPSPSGSATATPTESATPSATSTPSPAPTTPPPPARETGLTYTGATAGRYSDPAAVSARVTLPDGSPVPAGSVEFALGSGKVTLPVNSSGVASGRMPVLAGAGEQILVARYVSNSAYLGSAREVPFTVSRMPSKCAISRTTSGRSYVITGVLRDAAGRAIVGQTVYFAFNGTTHHAVRTDRYGKASLTVPTRSGTHTTSLRTNSFYSGCAASLRV